MMKQVKTTAFAAAALSLAAVSSASAEAAKSGVAWAGTTFAEDTYVVYAGGVYAFNQNIGANGFLLRLSGLIGEYDYDTAAVPPATSVNTDLRSYDAMLGYQTFMEKVRISVFGGIKGISRDQSPVDPTNSLDGNETGVAGQIELETVQGTELYVSAIAAAADVDDDYYGQLRVGLPMEGFILGVEGVGLGNDGYDSRRIGGFISGFSLGDVALSLSVGHANNDGGAGSDDGTYVSFGGGITF